MSHFSFLSKHNYFKNGFDLFELSRAKLFADLFSKEIKTNAAADKFHYFGLRNCGVRPRALGILRREIQKSQKYWRPDLFLK